MINGVQNMWNGKSDDYYGDIQNGLDMILDKAERAFPRPVWGMIRAAFPDLRGRRVLVPSSGDNIAAFGFYLLGAKVTSCDLAERQLFNAKKIADRYGWDIDFIQQNSMELDRIPDGVYDLVYTSNGVHVWIPDIPMMYGNFYRVLRPGGRYIMFETHPFIRPFDDSGPAVIIDKPYEDIGPFFYGEGDTKTTEYAWRVQDILNAAWGVGFNMQRMEEFHPERGDYDDWFYGNTEEAEKDGYRKHDWKLNPWAALPQWIGFSAEKGGGVCV
jgi:SAM-dependent methyltransferase